MGNDSSKPSLGSTSSRTLSGSFPPMSPKSSVPVGESAQATFSVCPPKSVAGLHVPSTLVLRIENEALVVAAPNGTVFRAWPYHRILCWGYTQNTFQWRVFQPPDPSVDAVPAGSGAKSEAATITTTTNSSTSTTAVSHSHTASSTASDSLSQAVNDVLSTAYTGPRIGTDALEAPETSTLPPGASAESVETMVVITHQGMEVEGCIMAAVRQLMKEMDANGVPDDEFNTLLATLNSLADEGTADHVLETMQQMSMTRKFTVRQATQLVRAVGNISPFDQVEAAVNIYESVMNKDSFPLVLECFPDPVDRENVCHRIGIVVDESGRILATKPKAAGLSIR